MGKGERGRGGEGERGRGGEGERGRGGEGERGEGERDNVWEEGELGTVIQVWGNGC